MAGFKADSVANQGSVREKAILGNGVVHVCFHPKDPNEASKGVCGRTWSTPVKPTKSRMLSLSPLRTLLPRVMTSNRARPDSELIQLPTNIKVRLLGTRRQSGTVPVPVPDLAGDGDAPPSPSPICPESGTLPRPRFPSGGPRPERVLSDHGKQLMVTKGSATCRSSSPRPQRLQYSVVFITIGIPM